MKKNKKYFTLTMSCIMICTSVLAAFPLQAYATSGTISETELDSSAGIYLEDKASVMLSNSTNKGNLKSGFKTRSSNTEIALMKAYRDRLAQKGETYKDYDTDLEILSQYIGDDGNKLMADEGIAHRQLAVHAFHHLEAVIATVFYHEESSRVPFHLHLFPQVECFRHKLAFHEESARRYSILSCHKRFPIGISHHTGEEIEVIYAWFARCYYISPHTFQGTHGDGLVGISQNLAGEELKILW